MKPYTSPTLERLKAKAKIVDKIARISRKKSPAEAVAYAERIGAYGTIFNRNEATEWAKKQTR